MKKQTTAIVLPDIRSAHNVGSIFRTADAAGVQAIYLVGHTPTPTDRFGRPRKDIAKVALGAEETVHWEYFKTFKEAAEELREQDFSIIAVEQGEKTENYKDFKSTERTAFVFGNEVEGLSKEIVAACDAAIEIPMHGTKESLNVAVTAGIILFAQE